MELDSKLAEKPIIENEVVIVDDPDEPDIIEVQNLSLLTNIETPEEKEEDKEQLIKEIK